MPKKKTVKKRMRIQYRSFGGEWENSAFGVVPESRIGRISRARDIIRDTLGFVIQYRAVPVKQKAKRKK